MKRTSESEEWVWREGIRDLGGVCGLLYSSRDPDENDFGIYLGFKKRLWESLASM